MISLFESKYKSSNKSDSFNSDDILTVNNINYQDNLNCLAWYLKSLGMDDKRLQDILDDKFDKKEFEDIIIRFGFIHLYKYLDEEKLSKCLINSRFNKINKLLSYSCLIKIKKICEEMIKRYGFTVFILYQFDDIQKLFYLALRELKKEYPMIKIVLLYYKDDLSPNEKSMINNCDFSKFIEGNSVVERERSLYRYANKCQFELNFNDNSKELGRDYPMETYYEYFRGDMV